MGNKKSHILKYSLYSVIGILCLAGGILYARVQKQWVKSIIPTELRSQVINQITNRDNGPLSPEKITERIAQLQIEIVEETNDPDRALKLRREVQSLKNQLKTTTEIQ